MEDPSEDYWEFDDYSQSYESKGKLGWAWRKGLDLGKKMIVAGAVISSAPLILPPLVVLSALGVAVSVPAGFAIITYACSEKLLDKLLPMSSPSPREEDRFDHRYCFEEDEEDEDVDAEEREFEDETRIELVEEGNSKMDKGYEEDKDIDADEREFEDVTRKEVEMRIEMVEEGNNKTDDYDRMPLEGIVEEDGYREDTCEYVEDEEKPLDISGISEEEMRRGETTGLIEEIRDEENKGTREIPIKHDTEFKGDDRLFVIPEEVTNEKASGRKSKGDDSVLVQEEPKPKVEQKMVVQVKTSGDHTATDVRLETTSDTKKGTLVISDADTGETAEESGLDLFDHATPSPDQSGDSINKISAGVHKLSIEPTLPVSERVKTASAQDSTAGSDKVRLNEDKIWAQIHALRTIVGYKGTPHSSCLEELKALYIFTGVEPPPSLAKKPFDLIDVKEKLHFLMSIIGVK